MMTEAATAEEKTIYTFQCRHAEIRRKIDTVATVAGVNRSAAIRLLIANADINSITAPPQEARRDV